MVTQCDSVAEASKVPWRRDDTPRRHAYSKCHPRSLVSPQQAAIFCKPSHDQNKKGSNSPNSFELAAVIATANLGRAVGPGRKESLAKCKCPLSSTPHAALMHEPGWIMQVPFPSPVVIGAHSFCSCACTTPILPLEA